MQSDLESPLPFQANSVVPVTFNTFPIQRLPDEILSRVIDVGSWADNQFGFTGRDQTSDTKPRQKEFVKIASQVCCRWREIAQWQGHPHRWRMFLVLALYEMDGDGQVVSRKLSQFLLGLRASNECDLLVRLSSWTAMDFNLAFDSDDVVAVNVQLFMHGVKMLVPYLPQIIALRVGCTQSDALHLLFSMLQRWPNGSRLTSLSLSYDGAKAMRARNIVLNSQSFECRLLTLERGGHDDGGGVLQSLPPTLAHLELDNVGLPKSFTLPYGVTRLSIRDNRGNIDTFHSLIPNTSQLAYLYLDLRNTKAPNTEFRFDGLLTFQLEIDLMSLFTWSRFIYAKSLKHLNLTVTQADSDKSISMGSFSLPSDDDEWLPLLAPVHLELKCSVSALRGILSLLEIKGLVTMSVKFTHRGRISWKMNEYLESLFRIRSMEYEGLIFPLLQKLWIVESGKKWCQTLEYASFPKLETLSCTRSISSRTNDRNEALDLTEWLSFSSTHESNSFSNLTTLIMWLPVFEAGQYHPFEHAPNIVELQVNLQGPWREDWQMWMIYPGPRSSPHSPPLTRLRVFAVKLAIRHNISLEDDLEAKIHCFQASRVKHGVGLEKARIRWRTETTEFRQNVTTGFLERVI